MTRRGVVVIVLTGATIALAAQGTFDRRHWLFTAPIDAGQVTEARLVSIVMSPTVTAQAQPRWADVRIVDDAGREVPYAVRARAARANTEWRPVRLLEPSHVAGQYTQGILDLGSAPRQHNATRLEIVRESDYLSWVEVAVGDDGRSWRVVRERAPIFDLTSQGLGASTTVSYPDSLARFVRVKLLDGSRPYRLSGAAVADDVPVAADLAPAVVEFVPSRDAPRGRTIWVSRPDAPRVPLSALRFETSSEPFMRPVGIETAEAGQPWRWLASGDISRLRDRDGTLRESLSIAVPETTATRWQVTVYDRDDAPVPDLRVVAQTLPRRVVFRQQPGRRYELVFGHRRVNEPSYDFGRLTPPEALDAAAPASLGAERRNEDYVDPSPWTERHAGLLWVALVVAVLALGGVSIRALRPSR